MFLFWSDMYMEYTVKHDLSMSCVCSFNRDYSKSPKNQLVP
jgi:hypothetical protein